ncbi:PAS domain S-box protein [Geojedonia litorea]|uniref:histidine kinase n=1 Tax=Geojedonia litorea TaxID=1268269 RepID=A0ABV9N4M7_9FLAO
MLSNKVLERSLLRERMGRKHAENLLEDKTLELFLLTQRFQNITEKLQDSLKDKNLKLEAVFSNSNDAYILIDEHGNIKNINQHSVDLFNMGVDLKQLNVLDTIYREDLDKYAKGLERLYKKGELKNFFIRIWDKDEVIRTVQINASAIYDEQKRPIGAHGIVRDVSESEADKQKIKVQKDELNIIIENSPIGVCLYKGDTLSSVLKVNNALCEMTGYSEQEFLNFNGKDLTYHGDKLATQRLRKKLNEGEIKSFQLEKRFVRKDGSLLWAKTYVKSILNGNGEIAYNIALIEDITQEREQSIVLNTINYITRDILGNVEVQSIASVVVKHVCNYLQADHCEFIIVDQVKKNYKPIAYSNFSGKGDCGKGEIIKAVSRSAIEDVINSKKPELIHKAITSNHQINGVQKNASQIIVPVVIDNQVLAVIHSFHDSEYRFNDINLNTLTNIANIVSIQLRNAINLKKLKKAEQKNKLLLKQLKLKNEDLSEYAHAVTHDLKSPMRSISSLLSWTKEDYGANLDDGALANFDIIQSKLQLVHNLIDGILEYSQSDVESSVEGDINVNVVIQDILNIIHIPNNFTINIQDQLPSIIGHRSKVQQLFQNLICNSIKYNDKPKGIIDVGYFEKGNNYVYFVKDNGIGIDHKYFKKVFKIFNKLDSNDNSTGIGLAIVKKIVEFYDGKIWLESTPEQGTTFFIKLKKSA